MPEALARWEMQMLDKILDFIKTGESEYARGKRKVIVSANPNNPNQLRYWFTEELMRDWHPEAIERLKEIEVISRNITNGIVNRADGAVFNRCYEAFPDVARRDLSIDMGRNSFITGMHNLGHTVLHQAAQRSLPRFAHTDIFGH